jgi:hypothetical protein
MWKKLAVLMIVGTIWKMETAAVEAVSIEDLQTKRPQTINAKLEEAKSRWFDNGFHITAGQTVSKSLKGYGKHKEIPITEIVMDMYSDKDLVVDCPLREKIQELHDQSENPDIASIDPTGASACFVNALNYHYLKLNSELYVLVLDQ